ncbi:hypothetical protein [uncultured Novosphingobium sp.]|uniref:hypothetical protein n=1 Tax=uncultured Novosphingobium sp. TaxID=292277 RepID=UPI00258E00B6|nr:hypothetical protein [uncultured Novosphingobium sp.]
MENAKLPGEVFSHATDAKQICDEALGKITVIRNNAGLDFRLTDCRQAAWSGSDYADEIIKSFDKSANSDRKEIQRLQHGYSALAESCRNPDVYLLQQAIK